MKSRAACSALRRLSSARTHSIQASSRKDLSPPFPTYHPPAANRQVKSDGLTNRSAVSFEVLDGGPSMERRQFFASSIEDAAEGGVSPGDEIPGLEPGRVIEVRRSEQHSLGVILASILVGGRPRLLILRQSGELWPVSPADVQFVMPASLVPPHIAAACWSPRLIELWSRGEDIGLVSIDAETSILGAQAAREMMKARRQATMVVRKVVRETERMQARLMGGALAFGRAGGVEQVWEAFAPSGEGLSSEERGGITAVQAAEWILNADGTETPITVRPNTLPAFAAHTLLMRRPDLFVPDDGEMWQTQQFLVRSRAERDRITRITRWIEARDEKVQLFADRPREGEGLKWSADDMDMISAIANRLYETRSTQLSPYIPISTALLNAIGGGRNATGVNSRIDGSTAARFLHQIGLLPASDSGATSTLAETAARHTAMSGTRIKSSSDLLDGNELDHLREDYTSHTVYVIDDATASELDDGISLEKIGTEEYWIHMHIADPTRYIPPGHPLALRASFVATSSYLPEGSVPLITHKDVMGRMSLGAGVDTNAQAVMTFSARVDTSGQVKDTKVALGYISKPKLVTYHAVNEALGIPQPAVSRPLGQRNSNEETARTQLSDEDVQTLVLMQTLAKNLRARRFLNAGLEFSVPTASVRIYGTPPRENIFDRKLVSALGSSERLIEYDFAVSISSWSEANAQNMVGELMVLANRLVAEWCHERSIPIPYRGSDTPRPLSASTASGVSNPLDSLLALRKQGTGHVEVDQIIKADMYLPSSLLSDRPIQHWMMGITGALGEGAGGYTRATSPLRRYDDLLVHWQIKSWLAANAQTKAVNVMMGADEIARLSKRSHAAQLRARRITLSTEQYWRGLILADLRQERHMYPLGRILHNLKGTEVVDVHGELEAIATGQPTTKAGMSRTQVALPQLGTTAALITLEKDAPPLARRGIVKIDKIHSWPSPIIDVTAVSM